MSKKKKAGKVDSSPVIQTTQSTVLESREPSSRLAGWMSLLPIVVLLAAVYSFSLHAPTLIVNEESILYAPPVAHIKNAPIILSNDFLIYTAGQYQPFSYIVLAAARTFVPVENVAFWHGWLLFFHLLNTLLVIFLVRHFTPNPLAGLASGLVFALHPLAAILVNDINCFYILMGLTLSLGAINAYLSFVRNGNRLVYILAVVLLILGMATARQAFVLGLILAAYEFFFRRNGWKQAVLRLIPFLLIPLLLSPIWLNRSPHPLHFKYVEIYEGSFWHGLFSFIGTTGNYLMGFLLGRGLLDILHETTEQIYSPFNAKFLLWAGFDFALAGYAVWLLVKKRWWAAFGVVVIFLSMTPYASVAFNRVVEYVSWKYLYFPLAGFALLAAGIYECVTRIERRIVRRTLQAVCICLVVFWGIRTIQINRLGNSPIDYWLAVIEPDPPCQTGLYELGKAYLLEGQIRHAIHYFFAPMVKDVKNPCLAMARYYCRHNEPLASAIHLRYGSGKEKTGMVLEPSSQVGSELLMTAGALDHAEENLGKILMVNPCDALAMGRLAQVWFYKGFAGEAYRMLERVRGIDPASEDANRLEKKFHSLERDIEENPDTLKMNPPSPDWLNYVLTQDRSPALRREIIELSDRLADDPIIQLEATISLLEEEKFQNLAAKVEPFVKVLTNFSYAMAVACRAYALSGDTDRAIQAGLRAVSLDSQNTLAWDGLAMAHAQRGNEDEQSAQFMKTVAQMPSIGSVYYYNLGLQKIKAELYEEAAALFEQAVAAKPDHYDAILELGKVYIALRKSDRAVPYLERARSMKSDDAQVYQMLGRAYMMLKENEKGLAALRSAIKIDPENAGYHYFLGFALDIVNQKSEAAMEYRRAVELNPEYADAHFKYGNSLFLEKKYEEAREQYQAVARIQPNYEYIHLNLSSVLMTIGRQDEAIAEVEEEIKQNPKIRESYDRLILLCCQKGYYDRARDAVNRAKAQGFTINQESQSLLSKAPEAVDKASNQ